TWLPTSVPPSSACRPRASRRARCSTPASSAAPARPSGTQGRCRDRPRRVHGGRLVTWRLSVRHSTQYRYEGVAGSSYNEPRREPRSDRHQTVLSSKLEVTPSARVSRHVDYWGTVVHHFDLQVPHAEL